MTVQAIQDQMPLGAWLRQQREAHGWSKREQARQLIKAGRAAGDTAMPGVDSLYHNVHRWERGENEPNERYRIYYCKTFGIPAGQFGRDPPSVTDSLSQTGTGTLNGHGLSITLHYASGRLVIETSGLDTQDREPEPAPGLSLVASHDPPRQYGGRA